MSLKTAGKFCGHCQKNVMAQGTKPNHLLHLVLSVFTGGLWLIVWLLITLGKIGGFRCTQCGNRV